MGGDAEECLRLADAAAKKFRRWRWTAKSIATSCARDARASRLSKRARVGSRGPRAIASQNCRLARLQKAPVTTRRARGDGLRFREVGSGGGSALRGVIRRTNIVLTAAASESPRTRCPRRAIDRRLLAVRWLSSICSRRVHQVLASLPCSTTALIPKPAHVAAAVTPTAPKTQALTGTVRLGRGRFGELAGATTGGPDGRGRRGFGRSAPLLRGGSTGAGAPSVTLMRRSFSPSRTRTRSIVAGRPAASKRSTCRPGVHRDRLASERVEKHVTVDEDARTKMSACRSRRAREMTSVAQAPRLHLGQPALAVFSNDARAFLLCARDQGLPGGKKLALESQALRAL